MLATGLLCACSPAVSQAGSDPEYPFGRGTVYPGITAQIEVATFGEDGHVDLFASGEIHDESGLFFLKGKGDGTFEDAVKLGEAFSREFEVVDLNGDEFPDLIGASDGSSNTELSVWLGAAGGTASKSATYEGGVGFTAGDFDGDGNLDVAWVASADDVIVRYGDGTGSFGPPTGVPVDIGPISPDYPERLSSLVAGDLSGDSLDDLFGLVTSRYDGGPLVTLIASADRTFEQADSGQEERPRSGESLDLNSDGYDDLILDYFDAGGTYVRAFLSDGSGGLSSGYSIGFGGDRCGGLPAAGELNGDSEVDLVGSCLGGPYTGANFVAYGDGTGDFSTVGREELSLGVAKDLELADLNEDGKLDAIFKRPDLEVQLNGINAPPPRFTARILDVVRVSFGGPVGTPFKPGVGAEVRCRLSCRAHTVARVSRAVASRLGLDSRVVAARHPRLSARREEHIHMRLRPEAVNRAEDAGLRRLHLVMSLRAHAIDPDYSLFATDRRSVRLRYKGHWLDPVEG